MSTQEKQPYRVCFVCSGNICRSPMAEVVLVAELARRGIEDGCAVDSAGIGDWHAGEPMDRRASRALAARGYAAVAHRARQFRPSWLAERDLVVALDRGHERALAAMARAEPAGCAIRLLAAYGAGAKKRDVADPYYGDDADFEVCLDEIEELCASLASEIARLLGAAASPGATPRT